MDWSEILQKAIILAVAAAITFLIDRLVTRIMRRVFTAADIPSASIFVNIVRGVIWAFGVLSILEPVFGIKPTAFVTALGISSVVLSFGLQTTVSNVFGGLGLMIGHIIQPGDYVVVSDFEGFVTDVTWRDTMVKDRNGNVQVIPNSVLNSSAFTRKSASQKGSCSVTVSLKPNANVSEVADEIVRIATEALGGLADPAYPVSVTFTSFDAYGTHGSIWLHVNDDVTFTSAQDKVTRALQGRPWLADALH